MTRLVTIDLDALNAYIDSGAKQALSWAITNDKVTNTHYYGKYCAYNDVSEYIELSGLVPEEETDD